MVHKGHAYSVVFIVLYLLFYVLHAHDVLYSGNPSKFISGDSITYLNAEYHNIVSRIIQGVLDGTVRLGSITSFVGPMLYVGLGKELFMDYSYLFYLFVNLLMYLLFVKNIVEVCRFLGITLSKHTVLPIVLFINPFYFNYLSGINKELISLLYLSGVIISYYKKNYWLLLVYTLYASIFREVFLAISIIFAYLASGYRKANDSSIIRFFIVVIVASAVIPLLVPPSFMADFISAFSGQKSIAIWSFLGELTFDYHMYIVSFPFKIILNYFGSLYPPVLLDNIMTLNWYAVVSAINSLFIAYALIQIARMRAYIDREVKVLFSLVFAFAFVIALNPISVSRYSYPIIPIIVLILMSLSNNQRRSIEHSGEK